jgi:hypothetical protein
VLFGEGESHGDLIHPVLRKPASACASLLAKDEGLEIRRQNQAVQEGRHTALIGGVVAERRLHSVATAAQEAGVGIEVIEPFLIEAGAVPDREDRPSSRRIFGARPYVGLLAEVPTLVGPQVMREAMGATKTTT